MNRDVSREFAEKLKNFDQVWQRVQQSRKQSKSYDKSALMPKNRCSCRNVRYGGGRK